MLVFRDVPSVVYLAFHVVLLELAEPFQMLGSLHILGKRTRCMAMILSLGKLLSDAKLIADVRLAHVR